MEQTSFLIFFHEIKLMDLQNSVDQGLVVQTNDVIS